VKTHTVQASETKILAKRMTESWRKRDNSWAPDTSTVAEDPVGPTGFGRVAVLVKRPRETGGELTEDNFRFETRGPIPDSVEAG